MTFLKPSNLPLVFLFIFAIQEVPHCNSQPLLTPIHGAFIFDLGGAPAQVASYASQWTINGAAGVSPADAFACATWSMLGRPGLLSNQGYLERIYPNLAAHVFVFYFFPIFIMDNWAATDYYEIQFDNRIYYRGYPKNLRYPSGNNYCGGSESDNNDFAMGIIAHTGSSLTLRVHFKLSNNAWLGFNNLAITLSNDTSKTEYKCSFCGTGSELCPCWLSFKSSDGSCQSCFENCDHCFGSSDSECYGCKFPMSYDGMKCKNHNSNNCLFFDFVNNKCSMCLTGVLAWDGTCKSSCNPPYLYQAIGAYRKCSTPCQSNNTFMLWDGTCAEFCDFPLIKRIEGDGKFCDYPCNFSSTSFLYSNGSCLNTCEFLNRTVGGYKFCDNCPGGGFIYPNRTCLSTCLLPRIAKVENQYNYCLSPCDMNQFYYIKKATCRPTCEFPNRVDDTIFCIIDVSEGAQNMLDTLGRVLNVTNQVTSATIVLSNIVSFSNPAAVLFGSMSDIISYIKYLRINYPPRLRYLLDQPQSEGLLQSISSIPQVVKNLFVIRDLPEEFEKYDIQSSFVVNFWQNYIILAAILCIIILIYLIKICISRGTCLNLVLKVNQIFQWNLFISFSIGYYGDLAFFSYLEIHTAQLDSVWPIFSFIASIVTNIIALALVIKIVMILREITTTKKTDSRLKRINMVKEKWKGYEVTFGSFKDDSLSRLAFLPIYITRLYVFNIIIAALFEHPLIQIVLVTLTSLLMLFYLIGSRPFKELKSLIENIVQETILMVINICVLILASLDEAKSDAFGARDVLGDIIIFVNSGFSILGSIYLNIQLLYHLVKMFSNFITKKRKQEQPRESRS